MWLSNTGSTAMIIPIAVGVLDELAIDQSSQDKSDIAGKTFSNYHLFIFNKTCRSNLTILCTQSVQCQIIRWHRI